MSLFKDKTLMITGAKGFVGKNLIENLKTIRKLDLNIRFLTPSAYDDNDGYRGCVTGRNL